MESTKDKSLKKYIFHIRKFILHTVNKGIMVLINIPAVSNHVHNYYRIIVFFKRRK